MELTGIPNEQIHIERDGGAESPWQKGLPGVSPEAVNDVDTVYDCLVVGAGITGITAGLMLQKAGKHTLIAEAHTVGFGTTSGTSAHINTFADTTYTEAKSAFGEDGATLFAQAVNKGADIIKNYVNEFNINCDYETKPGYIYAEDDDQVKDLQKLYDGAVSVKVPVEYVTDVPVPIPFKSAVKINGQAQFNPMKYLKALEEQYIEAGGTIAENTRAQKVTSKDGIHTVESEGKAIRAKKIIFATHIPPGLTPFNFECAPYRSYVIAVKLNDDSYPDALLYDLQDPYHYIRTHVIDRQKLLLVGGNDHKTGHGDPEQAIAGLEAYTRKYYNVESVKYSWSSQYYIPADGLPYTGQMPLMADGIYCATGFNGNGMMLGSISAKIMSDLVIGIKSPYTNLFSPGRIKPVASFTDFVSENADVAWRFIKDRFSINKEESFDEIKPGNGKVLEVDGKKVAAYRDNNGKIHALNPVCPHAKCIVNWNQEETSWDCPCHGARFNAYGVMVNGPVEHDLEKIDS